MTRVRGSLGFIGLSLTAVLAAGCGERGGSYTFHTTLDETSDVYVHPIERGVLDVVTVAPAGLRGAESLGSAGVRFAELSLGNIDEERQYLAIFETPGDPESPLHLVLDQDLDRDLSNNGRHPLRPAEEGSPYFASDTLEVTYPVDTGGVRHLETRKVSFLLRRGEGGESLRYEFVGHRVGRFDPLDGEPYAFILFDADNNGTYNQRDLLVIDTNRDGVVDGNRNSVERYTMSEPFLLGDRGWQVVGLNQRGTDLSIVRYDKPFTPHDRLETGEVIPDFTLKDVHGRDVHLSDYAGQTILLKFWASWCPPCRAQYPGLVEIAKEYADRNVVLVTVSYDDTVEDAVTWMKEQGYDYICLMDNRDTGVTGPLLQVGPIPTLFLIDRDGRIVWRHVGFEEGDNEALREKLDQVLAMPPA